MVPSSSKDTDENIFKGSAKRSAEAMVSVVRGGGALSQDSSRTWHPPYGTSFVVMKHARVRGGGS